MLTDRSVETEDITVDAGGVPLPGSLALPEGATALVIFAHGSGSSRFSTRNQFVARQLNEAGLGTLLFDLLTADEHDIDELTRSMRFDIDMLGVRLSRTVDWAELFEATRDLHIGLFGASTGAAAALVAAAARPDAVGAVVSRGGRPDLAGRALARVRAPTLLIVGGNDTVVIGMNEEASEQLTCKKKLEIVPDASHLFEEPGKLEDAARLARQWFTRHLVD